MMDLDDDDGPLKMEDGGGSGGSPGGSDDYILPRPPSPGGLQRTFTPVDDYETTCSPLPPLPPSSSSTSSDYKRNGRANCDFHLSRPIASPFSGHNSQHQPYSAPMGPPQAHLRENINRDLQRGYAMQDELGKNYFLDESPSDVMAFPPPTPYKPAHPGYAPASATRTPSSLHRHPHEPHSHHHPTHSSKRNGRGSNPCSTDKHRGSGAGPGSSGRRTSLHQGHGPTTPVSRFQTDFDVVRVIGSGCFGEVYRVRSRVDGVEYAVKCTRRRFRGPADRNRYLQEVKALAKVCAADSSEEVLHVVRYHQAWIEDERLFMQTELCEESLDGALRAGEKMGFEEVFDFMRQMLLALDVLHRHGLVHLDVKPGNIFIKAGVYKLGDFGLVASVNSSDGLGDSLVEGDSRYMSAELLQDGPKDLTKCDIFSLGATVYEMGRGRALPPNGEEWHALRSGHPPSLKGEPAVLVSDLMRVLAQMMAVGS
ncbi:wee1-like protein kinase [Nannochloropsis gaditana CCMP526]|nr:wee1-like protein kinase [Nannochloropsis gaditana CCMP526]EKU22084.1 wee1-like protein kinase [Nannochloropsis gaditana CCMP526]|eukprot:XP_005854279.1 wee1-like protein kinase [Nannochloropsis gaditana CCMP526]